MTPATIKKAALQLSSQQRKALARTLWKSVQEEADAETSLQIDRRMKLFHADPKRGIPSKDAFKIIDKAIDEIRKSKRR